MITTRFMMQIAVAVHMFCMNEGRILRIISFGEPKEPQSNSDLAAIPGELKGFLPHKRTMML